MTLAEELRQLGCKGRTVCLLRARVASEMQIRLTRKLADCLDGIDVSQYRVGDLLDIPASEAELLIAEGWASSVVYDDGQQYSRPTEEELRSIRKQLEIWSEPSARRRAEDLIREELRDAQSVTLQARAKTEPQ